MNPTGLTGVFDGVDVVDGVDGVDGWHNRRLFLIFHLLFLVSIITSDLQANPVWADPKRLL